MPDKEKPVGAEEISRRLKELTQIGIALTSERDLGRLLEKIVTEARSFAHADGGSLYIREDDHLHFRISQNETLERRLGKKRSQLLFKPFELPLSKRSIAGYVALTGKTLNISDVYLLDSSVPYQINRDFDKSNDYRTQSMLAVPMKDIEGAVLGVLQLINALDEDGKVISFSREIEDLTQSLASQAAIAVKNAQLTRRLKRAYLDTIYHLSVAAEYRDEDTGQHIRRISNYSKIIAARLSWPEADQERMLYASPMHDVGKLGIPDAVLQKRGKLTPEEWKIMQNHPLIGAQILHDPDSEILTLSEEIALSHHEKFNGGGYPQGLKEREIPLSGRIVSVADVFDALISKRHYKPPFRVEKAVKIIKEGVGKDFDPEVVEAFLEGLDKILEIKEKYRDEELKHENSGANVRTEI